MKYLCFFISCYKKNNNENKQNLLEKEIQNYEINNLINNESNNECFICLEPYKNNTCIKIIVVIFLSIKNVLMNGVKLKINYCVQYVIKNN